MRAGRLRHRLTLQLAVKTTGRTGVVKEDWDAPAATLGTFWGDYELLSGREADLARQTVPDATIRVRMRRVAAITPAHRLVFKGRPLNILSVDDVGERGRELVILCNERKPASG